MLDSHAFVIYRTQCLLDVFYFPFVVISLNWMVGFLTLKSVVQQAIKKSCHTSLLVAID